MNAPDGLVDFYRREHPRVTGALSLYCGDRFVAEELAHEAMVRACERWHELQQMDAPGAWVQRVAINLANSFYRRKRAERRARRRLAEGAGDMATRDPDGADAVAIRRAVASLPQRQRETLVLRFYLGLSVSQTATRMDTTGSAVKSLTLRAMRTLREEFALDESPLQEADDAAQ